MTTEERAWVILHYIDALTRAQNVDPFNKEISDRLVKACNYFEKIAIM